jgi:2,5-diamino-6-(ribosylamino)-4(3H)-pyrimidinone 5'-phosphate reductase
VKVIIHNAVSIDGRLTGFEADLATYYRLAGTWHEDATLCGSGTILASPEGSRRERAGSSWTPTTGDTRPLLAVADSRGRVRCWQMLRRAGLWRDVVALCSKKTPRSARDYLCAGRVDCIVAGSGRVDLRRALAALEAEYGVRTVRSDSGGTLNAALLDAGVVNEVSLLVHPVIVGSGKVDLFARVQKAKALKLFAMRRLGRGLAWLRWRAG